MYCMKKSIFFILFLFIISLPWLPLYAENQYGHKSKDHTDVSAVSGSEKKPDYPSMLAPGKKVKIGNDYYFIYSFDKKPKMGTVIMKVEIYTSEGKKNTSFEVKGDASMPSMRGAHDTGDIPFKLSQKRDYLLPINIVMPGDWEIRLTFVKDRKVIFRGSYRFNV